MACFISLPSPHYFKIALSKIVTKFLKFPCIQVLLVSFWHQLKPLLCCSSLPFPS